MTTTFNHTIPHILISPKYRIYRHLLLWLTVFFITANILWEPSEKNTEFSIRFTGWLLYFIAILTTIYINTYILVPRLLLKNKLLFYFLAVIFSAWAILLIIGTLQSILYVNESTPQTMELSRLLLNILSSTFSIGLLIVGSTTALLFKYWILDSQRISELKTNTLHSELKLLKGQINPHFLFNMLNNANLLIKKRSPEASQVLFKLEDLLRYQLNDSTKEQVLLSSDIHFLNDFLNLEKIRRDKFEFTIAKEGEINQIEIPPLMFIPFVENAVKHNPDSESYVDLSFKVKNNILEFQCKNPKPIMPVKNTTGGLGFRNIHRRLELLYPNRHQLEIVEDDNTYIVNLRLDL